MSRQTVVGYSFAQAILEKYQLSDEYGLPSASFVYLDQTEEHEAGENIRELVSELMVLNRLHLSVLNQSYERSYYLAVRMRCELLFAALSRELSWFHVTEELKAVYEELEKNAYGSDEREVRVQTDRIEARLKLLEKQAETKILETARKTGDFYRQYRTRTGIGESRTAAAFPGTAPSLKKPGRFRRHHSGMRRAAVALSAWRTEQAKQFFWKIQRAPLWEQRLMFTAAGVGSLSELMNYLKGMDEHTWLKSLSSIREQVEVLFEDQEFLSGLFPETAARKPLSGSIQNAAGGRMSDQVVASDKSEALRVENAPAAYRDAEKEQPVPRQEPSDGLEELSWLEQAQEMISGLTEEEWQIFKRELLEEQREEFTETEAFMADSPVFGWLWQQNKREEPGEDDGRLKNEAPASRAESEKQGLLEAISREQRLFMESIRETVKTKTEDMDTRKLRVLESRLEAVRELFQRSSAMNQYVDWEQIRRAETRFLSEPRLGNYARGEAVSDRGSSTDLKVNAAAVAAEEILSEREYLQSLLESEKAVSEQTVQYLLEAVRRRNMREKMEERYRTVMEAVSYLDGREWEQLKAEMVAAEEATEEEFSGPVLHWIRERRLERTEEKREASASATEISEEKHSLIRALMEESQLETMSSEEKAYISRRIFQQSQVLSRYLGREEETFFEREDLQSLSESEEAVFKQMTQYPPEVVRRRNMREGIEERYRAIMEAVSYLDGREWEQLKTEMAAAETVAEEDFSGPVLHWIHERRLERTEEKREALASATEISEEKHSLIRALMEESQLETMSSEEKAYISRRIFQQSQVLSRYLGQEQEEDRVEFSEKKELVTLLSSMTEKEWKGLVRELSVMERERLRILKAPETEETEETEERSGLQSLLDLLRSLPEGEGGEDEVRLQKQQVIHLLNQREGKESRASRLVLAELRRLELSERRRETYQTLLEATSYMDLEEWRTFRRELAKAGSEIKENVAILSPEAPVFRWIAGQREDAGSARPDRGGREEALTEQERAEVYMEMSKEKQAFLEALTSQFVSWKTQSEETEQEEEYRRTEEIFRKSTVLSRYVKWDEDEAKAVERGAGSMDNIIVRLTGESWKEFKREILKKLSQEAVRLEVREEKPLELQKAQRELLLEPEEIPAPEMRILRHEAETLFHLSGSCLRERIQGRILEGTEWLIGEERGAEAAIQILEQLRQSRMTVREQEQTPPIYDMASLVMNQSGSARESRQAFPGPEARREIKAEVEKQVQEQTTDIQFITRTQTVREELEAENRTELQGLLRRLEDQQRELEELKRKQETAPPPQDMSRISKSVMKRMQGQLQMERLRHGR